MNTLRTLLASALTLLAGCLLQAADPKPIARVISVQEIETDDPVAYSAGVAKLNEAVRAKLGAENYIRVYRSNFDGNRTNAVRVVTIADSIATLTKNNAAMENDPAFVRQRDQMAKTRKLGARTLYQCVRFEGTNKVNSNSTTLAVVTDEAGYLKSLEQLRALVDQRGIKDVKLNVYRVVAGRTNHTHRVTFSSPSPEGMAALMDLLATDAKVAEWIAGAAKYRTVVSNGTAQEITK